jgi:aldehyde:ferredoxin oxidoreductase
VNVSEPGVTSQHWGPEYETAATSESVCDIGDLKAIAKFHQLCGEYVMDTVSVGMIIAFGM